MMETVRIRKSLVIAAIVITALLPLVFVQLDEARSDLNVYKLLAKAGSLSGTMLIVWQYLLGHRATAGRVLVDLIWVFRLHKSLGTYILLLIALHPVFITIYYLIREGINPLALRTGLAFDGYVLLGMIALLIFLFVVLTSILLRARVAFQTWYTMHLSAYLALPLVFIHSFQIGQTIETTNLSVFWWVLLAVVVVFSLYRLICRLGLGVRMHVVSTVRQVGPEVTEITARPVGRRVEPAPGQFVYFRRGLRGAARPFTVSRCNSRTGEISVTVKAQGRTTTDLQSIQVGEAVYIDGPYGVFSRGALQGDRPLVMIAGGIGITPFYRIAERLVRNSDRELALFFGNKYRREIVYQDEFEALDRVRVVHVLSDEEDYEGETGYITPDLLKRHLRGGLKEHEFLICGPPEMTIKLESGLHEEGVPSRQIHHELFSY